MAVLDVQAESAGEATTLQVPAGDQLVPAEPDAVQWCITFWRSMQDRLRRQARELEREAERRDGIAANLNVWVACDFPWVHGARNAARLDAITYQREGKSGDLHRTVIDEKGEIGAPAGEARSPLQILRAAHRIDGVLAAAGDLFAAHFAAAHFELGKGTDYSQVRGTAAASSGENLPGTEAEEARHWIFAAMEALGGGASPMAMAVWSVVGAQTALDRFATSRHFRMPGGQRWLSVEEAEGVLRQGLAALAAYLAAPTVEHQHRRRGLKVRVAGSMELSFLVGSRRFKLVATYDPALKAWVGNRMAPRKLREGEKPPTEFRHWSVKGGIGLAGVALVVVADGEAPLVLDAQ